MTTQFLTEQMLAELPCIHEGRACRILLQEECEYGRAVAIKLPRLDCSSRQTRRLRNEFERASGAGNGVRRALARVQIGGRPALVLEYIAGDTLRATYVQQRHPPTENLEVAVAIAAALVELHRGQVVHRNLSCDHVLVAVGAAPRVALIDLADAVSLAGRGNVSPEPSEVAEQAFAYVSPEQTGRTSHPVDARADLYSFGAILYEVFTGRPVFAIEDPAKLIHCHLAQVPIPPRELNPDVPGIVSDLILRLLAKNPDERYQSAAGVLADLERCREQARCGAVEPFQLGEADRRHELHFSGTLCGREEPLRVLKEAVRFAAAGRGCFVAISGAAGVGKSALAEAVRRFATEHGAVFVEGLHDAGHRHVPYFGIAAALGELLDLILTEDAAQLAEWRVRLLDAVGGAGRLLAAVLPRLELIVGPQPPLPVCGPAEAHHQFLNLCHGFVGALASRERPLVVFLDNLQWADDATARLLGLLLQDLATQPITIIGAYRDDEVGADHPLAAFLDALRNATACVHPIALGPLPPDAVTRLIADAVESDEATVRPLAQVVLEKTGGTALLVTQFLRSLHEDGLLVFDPVARRWSWSIAEIWKREAVGGVARLMTAQIGRLPSETRSLLSVAACAGGRFTVAEIEAVAGRPAAAITAQLTPALEAGLLTAVPAGAAVPACEYEFVHERVRQAAYALLPRKERRPVHLGLGRQRLRATPAAEVEARVFEIVDQLNEGFQHLADDAERRQLAELNLAAGRRAKRTAAFGAAIRYLSMGSGLLPADKWEREPELARKLYLESIEAEYLCGNFERAALLSSELLAHEGDRLARARVHETRVLFLSAQGRDTEALAAGEEALRELGGGAPAREDPSDAESPAVEDTLLQLPPMEDPARVAAMRVLMQLTAPARRNGAGALSAIVARMFALTKRHGLSSYAAVACAWHGVLLCGDPARIEAGHRVGRLATDILRRFPAAELEPKVEFIRAAFLRPWCEDARVCLRALQAIGRKCLETGDLETAGLAAIHHVGALLCTGAALATVRRTLAEHVAALRTAPPREWGADAWSWNAAISALDGTDEGGDGALDGGFDGALGTAGPPEGAGVPEFGLLLWRTLLRSVFGDSEGAALTGRRVESEIAGVHGAMFEAERCFRLALALLTQRETAAEAAPLLDRFACWAALSPQNYGHRLALLRAEAARADGDTAGALEGFSRTVRMAREGGFVHDEALACEHEAAFFQSLGRDDLAAVALRNSVEAYRAWGAARKVRDIERRARFLLAQHPAPALDTAAVVKASLAVSQEIRLDRLLERLVSIATENAGAQRGALLQRSGRGFVVQARSAIEGGATEAGGGARAENCDDLSLAAVNYVARTLEPLVLGDACHDPTFGAEKQVAERRVRSLLCLPILHQGKLSGLIYLENNLAPNVFTAERLELLKAIAAQAAISMENAVLYSDLEHKVVALQQAEGELRREIEERKRTADALRQSEEKFRAIFEQTFQLIGVLAVDGTLLQANRSALALIGADLASVRGKPFWSTSWWTHSAALQRQVRAAVREAAAGKLVRFEASHTATDGTVRYVDFSIKPVTDDAGRVVLLVPEGRDITERKRTEERLRHLAAIVESSDDAIIGKTLDGVIVSWNRGAEQVYGYTAAEIIGRPVSLLVPSDRRAELAAIAGQLTGGEAIQHLETVRLRKDGRPIDVALTVSAIRDTEGRIVGASTIARDITQRKRAEAEMAQLRAGLEARVRDRTAELESKNLELERLNRLFVGRELRMMQLKERIGDLQRQLGGPAESESSTSSGNRDTQATPTEDPK